MLNDNQFDDVNDDDYNGDEEERTYEVSLPVMGDSWEPVETFDTREDAIAFAKKYFDADDNGCVCLISSFES